MSILHRDGPARLEITALGDLPRRPSTAVHLFGRSAALGGAAGVVPRYSAHSRIAKRSRKRNAKSHSCSRQRPIGQHANRSGKLAARIHSRIQLPAHRRALDMALAAFGTWSAIRFCQVARSSPSVLRCGPRGRALIDQRGLDARANMNRSPTAASGV